MGRFLEEKLDVLTYVLTFNFGMDYTLLNEELRVKYFQDYENTYNFIVIKHWSDFLKKLINENRDSLSDKEIKVLTLERIYKDKRIYDPSEINGMWRLMIIARLLNNMKKKIIIMIDEVDIYFFANKSKQANGQISYNVDFSYLDQYQNVHFILCLRPSVSGNKDFDTNLPAKSQNQLYKILTLRHRNTKMILDFLRFWQHKGPYFNGFPRIINEQMLDSESLPPALEGLDHGVIWIPFKHHEESLMVSNLI